MIARFPTQLQKGVSLIEVLIAVLIFSLGLIGIAGLLVMATNANHGAYQRTQVTYLAHNMANRMSANPVGVWSGAYDATYDGGLASVDCSGGCDATNIAKHDQALWDKQLQAFLPDAKATIECSNSGVGYIPQGNQLDQRPPFGGTCTMTISWSDRGTGGKDNRQAETQTFAWEFQP